MSGPLDSRATPKDCPGCGKPMPPREYFMCGLCWSMCNGPLKSRLANEFRAHPKKPERWLYLLDSLLAIVRRKRAKQNEKSTPQSP